MSNSITVVAAIIRDGDKILACRRAANRSSGGKWEFPGGKIESGETPGQALAREIAEELSVGITVGALVDRSTTHVGDLVIDLACYAATLVDRRPSQSTDHDCLKWVHPKNLPALDWAAPDLPAVRAVTGAPPNSA